jgi:uncharacterized protein YukE
MSDGDRCAQGRVESSAERDLRVSLERERSYRKAAEQHSAALAALVAEVEALAATWDRETSGQFTKAKRYARDLRALAARHGGKR